MDITHKSEEGFEGRGRYLFQNTFEAFPKEPEENHKVTLLR
jgi:hypothetical protein